MSFARHQTFYLRSGWLAKAVDELRDDENRIDTPFSGEEAPGRLGIGKNMVQSLRFWVQACNIAEYKSKRLELSDFGQLVKKHDPYFEKMLTWWIIHSFIATRKEYATSWCFLFNEFKPEEFSRLSFVEGLQDRFSGQASDSSFLKDFDCIVSSYSESDRVGSPEENTECPLRKLGLLKQLRRQLYRKSSPEKVPLEVLYLVMSLFFHCQGERKAYNVSDLMMPGNIGPVFNLSIDSVYRYLDKMQDKGWVYFSRTAGLDALTIENIDHWIVVEKAYNDLKGGGAVES